MLSYRERQKAKELARISGNVSSARITEKSSVIKFLNSPFSLWLFSAVFISSGSYLYSRTDQCFKDASALEDRYEKIGAERVMRRIAFTSAALTARSVDEIKILMDNRDKHGLYREYRDMSLPEIDHEFKRIVWKGRSLERRTQDEVDSKLPRFNAVAVYVSVTTDLSQISRDSVQNENMVAYQDWSKRALQEAHVEAATRTHDHTVIRCSLLDVLRRSFLQPDLPVFEIDRREYESYMDMLRKNN